MNDFFNGMEINWRNVRICNDISAQKIETIEEYVEWVGEWKEIHRKLIAAIKHFRLLKNKYKLDGDSYNCQAAWMKKKGLGQYARRMYEARVENKVQLKAGAFKEAEKV